MADNDNFIPFPMEELPMIEVAASLSDLVGNGILDAVDFGTEGHKRWTDELEDCQVCRFRLNGTTYLAVEDPNDGYRSGLEKLIVQEGAKLANIFPAIEVLGVHRTKRGDYRECDIIELIDMITGKVVLEIGTDNTDDYYPSFVASFSPENMATNLASAA